MRFRPECRSGMIHESRPIPSVGVGVVGSALCSGWCIPFVVSEPLVVVVVDDVKMLVSLVVVGGVVVGLSTSKSLSKVSRGTLHPHPFRSEKLVKRHELSRPCSSGLNGLRSSSIDSSGVA